MTEEIFNPYQALFDKAKIADFYEEKNFMLKIDSFDQNGFNCHDDNTGDAYRLYYRNVKSDCRFYKLQEIV